MDHQHLKDYILELRSTIKDDVRIAGKLLEAGWHPDHVREAFNLADQNSLHSNSYKRLRLKLPAVQQHTWLTLAFIALVGLVTLVIHLRQTGLLPTLTQKGIIKISSAVQADQTLSSRQARVKLSLTCPQLYTCLTMSLSSNGISYSQPEPFRATRTWELKDKDGPQTIYVKLLTRQHQTLLSQLKLNLDRKPPVVKLLPPGLDQAKHSVSLAVTVNEPATCKYDPDAQVFAAMKQPLIFQKEVSTHTATVHDVAPGDHKFYIKCRDQAGNITLTPTTAQVNMPAPPAAAHRVIPYKPATTPSTTYLSSDYCPVDFHLAPDLINQARQAQDVCVNYLPKVIAFLGAPPHPAPYKIVFDDNQYAAYVWDNTMHISISFARNYPDIRSAVGHEITHLDQNYGPNPSWATEGIADFMRHRLGFVWEYFNCKSTERWTSGYGCTASFLTYVTRVYDPYIVRRIHQAATKSTYSDSLFQTYTHKSAETLYTECLKAECKGGKP